MVFTQVTTYTPGTGLHTSHNISYPGTLLHTSHIIHRDWSLHKSQHNPWDWSSHKSQHIPLGLVFTQVTTYTPGTGIHTSHNIYPWDGYSHKSQHIPQGLVFTQVTTYTPGTGIHTSPNTSNNTLPHRSLSEHLNVLLINYPHSFQQKVL